MVLSIVDSGPDVPVCKNVTGRGMMKANSVGIPWSTVLLTEQRYMHTKLGDGKQGYQLARSHYFPPGQLLPNSPAEEVWGTKMSS